MKSSRPIASIFAVTVLVCESLALSAASAQTAVPAAGGKSPSDQIAAIAAPSQCAGYHWKDRGQAPKAYIKGMALVFARAVCQSSRPDVSAASTARGAPGSASDNTDALTFYESQFHDLGMSNEKEGVDTLRHVYTLQIGLGMRESSGKYCSGRDRSANFTTADSAEAGTFQTSWGASKYDPSLPEMYKRYTDDQSGCLLDVFRQGVTCSLKDAETWGTGTGADWQKLTKACPAFAAEYASVVMRVHGGKTGEFGPLRKHAAEVRRQCDSMLLQIQHLVQSDPGMCSGL